MYLVYYDGDMTLINMNNKFSENIAKELKCNNYYTLDNNRGITETYRLFNEVKNKYDIIITNELMILNAYLPENVFILKVSLGLVLNNRFEYKLHKLQDLTNRKLRPAHNLVKLYLAGEFNKEEGMEYERI